MWGVNKKIKVNYVQKLCGKKVVCCWRILAVGELKTSRVQTFWDLKRHIRALQVVLEVGKWFQ